MELFSSVRSLARLSISLGMQAVFGLALVSPMVVPATRAQAAETLAKETLVEEPSAAEAELEADIPRIETPTLEGAETPLPEAEDSTLDGLNQDPLESDASESLEEVTPDADAAASERERVYLAERQISFVLPDGFTAMSSEEINLKFPGSMPPQFAYGNDRRNVSIGVSLSDIDLAPEQLPEVRQFLESFLEESVPGFDWVSRDYENIGGSRWIKLEFISQALDTQVHNDLYITSFKGKLLGFNFNSVLDMERVLRPQLNDSRSTIFLDPMAAAQGDRAR